MILIWSLFIPQPFFPFLLLHITAVTFSKDKPCKPCKSLVSVGKGFLSTDSVYLARKCSWRNMCFQIRSISSRHLIYIRFCVWLGLFVDRWWLKEVWYAPDCLSNCRVEPGIRVTLTLRGSKIAWGGPSTWKLHQSLPFGPRDSGKNTEVWLFPSIVVKSDTPPPLDRNIDPE